MGNRRHRNISVVDEFITKIRLPNRYGDNNFIYKIESSCGKGKWIMRMPPYTRCIYDGDIDEHKYVAIDPPGGPFMEIGGTLNGEEIVSIYETQDTIFFDTRELEQQ